jgi:hypothetical protein
MAEIESLSLRSRDGELAGLRAAAPRMRSLRSLAINAEPAAVLDVALSSPALRSGRRSRS